MRKLSLLVVYLFLIWSEANAEKDQPITEYTAINSITYHVGDILRTNRGSLPNGTFRYIYFGVASMMRDEDSNTDGDLKTMTVKEIKHVAPAFNNHPEIVFFVEGDDHMPYSVRIDKALEADEIITIRSESDRTPLPNRTPRPQRRPSKISVSDELVKLKSLQDNGVLRPWEYSDQKEKLLNNGAGTISVADELLKLKVLLDKGVLRTWEYNEQKEKLLKGR